MTFGAGYEEPPLAWGVGRVVVDDRITPWPVSEADIADEAASLAPHLSALGLGEGGLVLIVSLLSQAIHVHPFERAAGSLGALYSSADRTPFDAYRSASLIRQLQPAVVMGIDDQVLDGLEEGGRDPVAVFGGVRTVLTVDDGAHERLTAAGLTPRRWLTLGPTSAIQPLDDDALAYDASRWLVEVDGGPADRPGELLLTSRVPRLTPCRRFRTGRHGTVAEPGRIRVAS